MDAMHALGYTMLISRSTEKILDWWRQYYEEVQMIAWAGDSTHGGICMADPTCVHFDPDVAPPPPNATHLNIPIW